MTCRSIQQKLSSYVDGELSGFEMLDVRSHLSGCAACRSEAEELRALKGLLGNMTEAGPDSDFHTQLNKVVFESPRTPAYRPVSLAVICCVAFATTLILGLAGFRTPERTEMSAPVAVKPDQTAFDVSRDQAYQAGSDVFNGGSFIITASAPTNGSR
jgi:anti-sigma factor RsiW